MSDTTNRRQFLANALAGTAGVAAVLAAGEAEGKTPGVPQDREGVKLLAQVLKYGNRIDADLGETAKSADVPEDTMSAIDQALKAIPELTDKYAIVLPDSVNALMKHKHSTAHGNQTAVGIAHKIAKAVGQDELAAAIEQIATRSSHFQGRATEEQVAGLKNEFGNPTLYQIKIVDKETGAEGRFNVDLSNFDQVGLALEGIDRVGQGQSIMSQNEYKHAFGQQSSMAK